MDVNYIALAIPFFFLFIGIEVLIDRLGQRGYYRFNDSINNLACGITEQVWDVFVKTALFAGYLYLYHHHALLTLPMDSAPVWILAFLGVDVCYYWFHRASHEVALIWGAHIVHHQSEEFNLTVALRQDAFQRMFSWVFNLPLALLGVPPVMFLTLASFNTLYQFWIHTRAIGKLGAFEWVFNTPSHHRVHHGSDPKYLDKNYGGTLIVWDRLFGSFQEEQEEPHYGIVKPLGSWNPLWANVAYWLDLARASRRMPRLADKLRVWFKRPGWQPGKGVELPPQDFVKYDTSVPLGLNLYILVQFVPALLGATYLLGAVASGADPGLTVPMAAWVVLTLTCLCALLERRRWGWRLELGRLLATFLLAPSLAAGSPDALVAAVPGFFAATVASGLWLLRYRKEFDKPEAAVAAAAG